jgi:hypothetical protein
MSSLPLRLGKYVREDDRRKGWVLEGSSQQDVLGHLIQYDYYGGRDEREVGCKGKRGKGDGTHGE